MSAGLQCLLADDTLYHLLFNDCQAHEALEEQLVLLQNSGMDKSLDIMQITNIIGVRNAFRDFAQCFKFSGHLDDDALLQAKLLEMIQVCAVF